jgi:hypothetical protein
VEGLHSVDPPASQLIDPKNLKPGVPELTQEMVKRYKPSPLTRLIPPPVGGRIRVTGWSPRRPPHGRPRGRLTGPLALT